MEIPVVGAAQDATVAVPADATFGDIRDVVAAACNVQANRVEISCNNCRVIRRKMTVRPSSQASIVVWVTGVGGASDYPNQVKERIRGRSCIAPKPIIMTQDTEAHDETECLSELIDNSIRAAAKNVTVDASARGSNAEVTALTCEDDGVGMTDDNATNFMRLAHTDSGIVTAVREYGKPLALQQYFSEQLSRHGKGALALLSFGSKITTATKRQEAVVAVKVVVDYEQWLQEFATTNNCQYGVDVYDVFDLTAEDTSYTQILVEKLKHDVSKQFTDSSKVAAMTTQLADTYHFFVHGLDERLWLSAPAELRPDAGPAAGMGRPVGGVTIKFFGYNIGRAIPDGARQPQLALMLDKFFQLQSVHGDALKPFWLPVRWVDPESQLRVDDVPSNVTTMGAFAASGGADGSGPAGRLRNVHRDFLLLLFYFPFRDGKRSKPEELLVGGSELCMFPVWSGRLIPDASYMARLPALVAEATKGGTNTFKLVDSRLCGILFCSPECYTTNHKTSFQEPAFKRALECGSKGSRAASELFVWDTYTQSWAPHCCATEMLQRHFEQNWAKLERDGSLVDGGRGPDGLWRSLRYKLADRTDHILAGQLVRVRTDEEKQAVADMARSGASSSGPTAAAILAATGSAAAGGGRGRGRGRGGALRQAGVPALLPDAMPVHYRVVLEFKECGPDSGTQHKVTLQEWTPSWCPVDYKPQLECMEVANISVLAPSNSEADRVKQALESIWEASAPHHLAWYGAVAAGQDKVVTSAQQLTAVPSVTSLAPSQVPDTLTACLATPHGALVSLEGNRWNSATMSVRRGCNFSFTFWLERNKEIIKQVTARYTLTKKGAVIEGLRQMAQLPGEYTLKVTAPHTWVKDPLSYSFKVVAAVPATLHASWEAGVDDKKPVPLGAVLPGLEITAKNASGENVALPLPNDHSSIGSMCTVTLQAKDPPMRNCIVKTDGSHPFTDDKREALFISGWSVVPQDLKLQKGRSGVMVEVAVQLQLETGDVLTLAPSSRPSLYLVSGPPARVQPEIESSEEAPLLSTRGTTINIDTIVVLDAKNNAVDMSSRTHCACVTFEPHSAIQTSSPDALNEAILLGAGAASDGTPAVAAAAAGGGASSGGGKRAKARRSMGRTEVAYAFPCKVDGNAVDFKNPGLKWSLAPGQHAKAIISVYKGPKIAAALDRANRALVVQHVYHFRMHRMQAQLQHPWIDQLLKTGQVWADLVARRRPRRVIRAAEADALDFAGEAYELSTFEDVPTQQIDAGTLESNLHEEIIRRLIKGYERRSWTLAGAAVDVYLTPNGSMLWASSTRAAADGAARLVPPSLVDHWNSLPKDPNSPDRVLDVAFVLPPDKLQLEGVQVQFFREDDVYDDDFYCYVKVICKEANEQLLPGDALVDKRGLQLPLLTFQRAWFTAHRHGTITICLLYTEDQQQQQQQAGSSAQQQQQQQQQVAPPTELGRFYVRLAPCAEQICLLPTGKLFEGTVVNARFGTDCRSQPEQRRLLFQEQPRGASRAASSSSSGALGAWAPWVTDKRSEEPQLPAISSRSGLQAASKAAAASRSVHAVQPWGLKVSDPIVVRLGELLVFHFVATDLARCPAALTAAQVTWMQEQGLQIEARHADTEMSVEAVAWSWAGSQPGRQQQQLPPGHLGGQLVNAVTCRVLSGCGPAQLKLLLPGSAAEPATLDINLMVEAGPVAADGLWLDQVTTQQQQQQHLLGASSSTAAAAAAVQVYALSGGILADRHTWEFMPEVDEEPGQAALVTMGEPGDPAAAAAAAGKDEETDEQAEDQPMTDIPPAPPAVPPPSIKPDPELPTQQQGQQQRQRRRLPRPQEAAPVDVIEILDSDSDDDDVVTVEHPPVQQQQQQQQQRRRNPHNMQSARARRLAQLSTSNAAVLWQLKQIVEGSTVALTVQLRDDAGHDISADTAGTKLRLLHHKDWQQPGQQQQQQACNAEMLQHALITKGRAELQFRLGVGDEWLGQQLFEILPVFQQAAGSSSSTAPAAATELHRALPLLLLLEVVPGNYPEKLRLQSDLGAGSAFLATAAEAAAAVLPQPVLQQYSGTDAIEASMCNCTLKVDTNAAGAAAGGAEVLTLQLNNEQYPAAAAAGSTGAELPGFAIALSSRDRQPLAPRSVQPLQLQLQKWQPPPQQGAAAGAGAASPGPPLAGFDADSCWHPVSGSNVLITAEPEHPGAATAEYKVDDGAVALPNESGLFRLTATYGSTQQSGRAAMPTCVAPLHIGPFILLAATPSRLVQHSRLQQQQQQHAASAAASPARPRSAARRGKGPIASRSSGAAAAAAAGLTPAAAAAAASSAPVPVQAILLAKLAETRYPGENLYLQDAYGNAWRAAAASLAAKLVNATPASTASPGGRGGRQQQQQQPSPPASLGVFSAPMRSLLATLNAEPDSQQQHEGPPAKRQRLADSSAAAVGPTAAVADEQWCLQLLLVKGQRSSGDSGSQAQPQQPLQHAQDAQQIALLQFDAEGCCSVAATSLSELGIAAAGDYRLEAVAVVLQCDSSSSSSGDGGAIRRQLPPVLLAHYRVAAAASYELEQRRTALRNRASGLEAAVQQHKQRRQQLQQDQLASSSRLEEAQLQLGKAAEAVVQYTHQLAGYGQLVEDAPLQELLRPSAPNAAWPQLPCAQPGRLLITPRMQGQQQQQHLPAPPAVVNLLLGGESAQEMQRLIHERRVLGPLVSLAAVERSDVAQAVSGLVSDHLLKLPVCISREGELALEGRSLQHYALHTPEAVSYFTYLPHLHAHTALERERALQLQLRGVPAEAHWMWLHPQQLIPPSPWVREKLRDTLCWYAYAPQEGFVGFAVNLLHLTHEQLAQPVHVRAVPRQQGQDWRLDYDGRAPALRMGLRHSLWASKLSNVLVFESKQHVQDLRQRMEAADGGRGRTLGRLRLISLDGGTYGLHGLVGGKRLTMPAPGGLLFSGLPQTEVLPEGGATVAAEASARRGPLDLRLRSLMDTKWRLHAAEQQVSQLNQVKQQEQQKLQQGAAALHDAQQAEAAAEQREAEELPGIQKDLECLDLELRQLG